MTSYNDTDRFDKERPCNSRMTSPALSVPGVLDALQSLSKAANEAADQAGLPQYDDWSS